jgi:MerR family mercuric resistance operon transcriptional regulator
MHIQDLDFVVGACKPLDHIDDSATDFATGAEDLNSVLHRYGTHFQGVDCSRGSLEVEKLTISRLASQGGVNLETVRYYERKGLLPKPPRTKAGYRIFPDETLRRLRFIKRTQQLGFSLTEIREFLALRIKPRTEREHIRAQVEAKIVDIEREIKSLEAMKNTLQRMTERCDGCGPLPGCPILASLESLEEEMSE